MPDLNDLRKKRAAAADTMGALADALSDLENAEAPDAAALEAKGKEFAAAKADFERLDGQIKRAETAEAARAAAARPAQDSGAPGRLPAQAALEADAGVGAGLFVMALAAAKGDPERAAVYAEKRLGASGVAGELLAALNTGVAAAGGVLIPSVYSGELIKMLKARAVVRKAGARVIDMPSGNIRDARQTGAATAAYGTEIAAIPASEPTFGEIVKSFKKLTALVPVSNSLIRHGSPGVAAFVRDDLVEQMRLREDLAFIRDDGTAGAPKGLRYWAKPAQVFTGTVSTLIYDLRKCVRLVEEQNIPMTTPGWLMRPGARSALAELRDGSGQKYYPEIDEANTLLGFPIHPTTQIPANLGAGTSTEIYFVDFNEIVIGDSMAITVDMSAEAAYVDGAGATVSAYQRDMTLMRAISEHDLAPSHDEAIAVLTTTAFTL